MLVFKDKAPVGEEAAGGNTALDQLKRVSHQGSAFEDLYAVHMAGVHCKARAFQHRASAKFGKSIPGWAVLLLAETCPGDCKRGTGARVFGMMVRARCNT